jgi:aminopeptidase-like protein
MNTIPAAARRPAVPGGRATAAPTGHPAAEDVDSHLATSMAAAALPKAASGTGESMHAFCGELYPLLRSITGRGVRETLAGIGRHIPIALTEVPSGTPVFDWTVPPEWTVRAAWVKNPAGEKILDIERHNLHLVNYSAPFSGRMPLSQLRSRLFSLPDRPDWIPYRTQYFKEDWGFCLSDRQLQSLPEGEYEVCVDTTLAPGSLTFGECVLPGRTTDEVLVSAHVCHPSLANDNLSGIAVATFLARALADIDRHYTYRFVFAPSTIGVITWLAQREAVTPLIRHGLVISGVGDPGGYNYKRSRRGDAQIDRVMAYVLARSGLDHRVNPFIPYGYDERQYCSPGFNLPVGCFSRSTYGSYPQYHTSADNLDLVRPEYLEQSLDLLLRSVGILERDRKMLSLNPKCEPQLGRRGLYSLVGGHNEGQQLQLAMLWVLNKSDGLNTLLDIANESGIAFDLIYEAAVALTDSKLLASQPG